MSYLLPLGPFDRTWRGPQRVVLRAEGERIVDLQHQTGYHARGCAARLLQLPLHQCYPLVNRVCGVHSHHHALAWTMALEQLGGIEVPPRAEILRALVAEAERIASHLYDAAHVFALLGLDPIFQRLVRLRELALDLGRTLTGHRLVHDFVRPGGVQHDLHSDERVALHALLTTMAADLRKLLPSLVARRGIAGRTRGLAVLKRDLFEPHCTAGWRARASGIDHDLRRDRPYGIYLLERPAVVVQDAGDARARLLTLVAEAYESTDFSLRVLADLPDGRWRGDLIDAVPAGSATVAVEAPSGVLTYRVVSDGDRLAEVSVEAYQMPDAVLHAALARQLVDDAGLIAASLAPCSACAEA